MKINNQKLLGILAIIGASLLFGLGYTFGDVIIAEGMSETCNGLWTGIFAILFNAIIGFARKENPFRRIPRRQTMLCIVSGVCAVWLSNLMFLVAYKEMDVAEVTMLHFLYPSLIAVFMSVAFKERFTKEKFGAIVSSVLGMLIITGGFRLGHPVSLVAALTTGILYAVYPVMLETTSLKKVPGSTVVMYMNIVSALSALAVSLAANRFMLPVNGTVLLCQLAVSLTSVCGFLLTAYGVKVIGATNASFGSMLEPVASCMFAAAVLGQSVGKNVLIGSLFIILSILFTSLHDVRCAQRKQYDGHEATQTG